MPPEVLERFERSCKSSNLDPNAWFTKPRRTEGTNYRRVRRIKFTQTGRGNKIRSREGDLTLWIEKPWEALPTALRHIRDAIEESKQLLELQDDWDEEGSLAIEEAVWRRAANFLTRYARFVWSRFGKKLDAPDITPGPDGSIDLHWNQNEYEMLVNIRRDPTAMAGFYGDDRGNISIKGTFDPDSLNEGLILWLKKAR
jgi:hypothetical protein